jgi:glucan endo-1,3-alpha-glucosidase
MNRRDFVASISIAAALPSLATLPVYAAVSVPKMVFAHYMVAWPRGGPQATIASYQSEFTDAHARGIDGFALNCGGWNVTYPYYKQRVQAMYQAASSLGFAFKLFVSMDGAAQNEIDDIVATTSSLPAQLLINGRPVLSAYAAGGGNVANLAALVRQAESLGAYFVPHFFPSTGEQQITATTANEIVQDLGPGDGYFYFGAAGMPWLIGDSIAALGPALKANGKLFMAPVTPYYRGLRAGTNYRAFETNGFSGMATEWETAISSGADWVEIVTWNDWSESTFVDPIGGAVGRAYVYDNRFGYMPSHTGYLDASVYYINWFKTGVKPTIIQDELFYYYRLHPILTSGGTGDSIPPASSGLSTRIHVSTFLIAPATLTVCLPGITSQQFSLPAGVTHIIANSGVGAPHFSLQRSGVTVIDKTGEQAITANDFSGQYNYFSGGS